MKEVTQLYTTNPLLTIMSNLKRQEPLEELEKVLSFLAQTPVENNRSEFSDFNLYKSSTAEASDFKNRKHSTSTAKNDNSTIFDKEVEQFLDNANTSKDFESDMNLTVNTNFVESNFKTPIFFETEPDLTDSRSEDLSVIDHNITSVTKDDQENLNSSIDDGSLEEYLGQFKTIDKKIIKTPFAFKSDLEYEDVSRSSVLETEKPNYREDVTEFTVCVKGNPHNRLRAILCLKERKSKSARPESSLSRSKTKWLVYPINNTPKQRDSPVSVPQYQLPINASVYSRYNKSPVHNMPQNYSNQFRHLSGPVMTKTSYEAADDDYFNEVQPSNSYIRDIVQDRVPATLIKHLGIVTTDPDEYAKLYSNQLVAPDDFPVFINNLMQDDMSLAYNFHQKDLPELQGDLDALKLVDLDKESLSEYKDFLITKGIYHA